MAEYRKYARRCLLGNITSYAKGSLVVSNVDWRIGSLLMNCLREISDYLIQPGLCVKSEI